MLLNIVGSAFPGKTFLIILDSTQQVVDLRIFMVHLFYDLGLPSYKFRLRNIKENSFLNDSDHLCDVKLFDDAVVEVVSMTMEDEMSKGFHTQRGVNVRGQDGLAKFKQAQRGELFDPLSSSETALFQEVTILDRRVGLLNQTRVFVWVQGFLGVWALVSSWMFGAIWTVLVTFACIWVIPKYSRSGGYVKRARYRTSHIKFACGLMGAAIAVDAWIVMTQALILFSGQIGCESMLQPLVDGFNVAVGVAESGDDCSACDSQLEFLCRDRGTMTYLTFAVYAALVLVYFSTIVQMLILIRNMKFKTGDKLRPALLRSQGVDKILSGSKWNTSPQMRLQTAIELSTLVSVPENQTDIIEFNGIRILIELAATGEIPTQEFAIECLSCLSSFHPREKEIFSDLMIVTLAGLLFSKCHRTTHHAIDTLYNISQTEVGVRQILKHNVLIEITMIDPRRSDEHVLKSVATCLLSFASNRDMSTEMAQVDGIVNFLLQFATTTTVPLTAKSFFEVIELLYTKEPKITVGHGKEIVEAALHVADSALMDMDVKHVCFRIILSMSHSVDAHKQLLSSASLQRLQSLFMMTVQTAKHEHAMAVAQLITDIIAALAHQSHDAKEKLNNDGFLNVLDAILCSDAAKEGSEVLCRKTAQVRTLVAAGSKKRQTQMRFET